MLNVQKYLQSGKTLNDLEIHFGIKSNPHPEDGRVILNYDQIDSAKHKMEPIVRECRGLVLDRFNDWALVTRGFYRFFNFGENEEDTRNFDWDSAIGTFKEDGSYAVLYNYNGKWHVNTRNSFGHGVCNEMSGLTWREVFLTAAPPDIFNKINPEHQCVFELCSPYNQVVRRYKHPQLFLLTVFNGETELTYEEMCSWYYTSFEVSHCVFNMESKGGSFKINEVKQYIEDKSKSDPTFEGIVVRDKSNNRLKIKSLKYLELHKLNNNGNIVNNSNLIKFVLDGERDELVTYFPHVAPYYDRLSQVLTAELAKLESVWFCHWDNDNRKKFAQVVQDSKSVFSWALFEGHTRIHQKGESKDNADVVSIVRKSKPEKVLSSLEKLL